MPRDEIESLGKRKDAAQIALHASEPFPFRVVSSVAISPFTLLSGTGGRNGEKRDFSWGRGRKIRKEKERQREGGRVEREINEVTSPTWKLDTYGPLSISAPDT